MGSGMAVFGRITTTDVSALQAHAQVDPRIAGLHTFLATFGMGFDFLHVIGNVRTSSGHGENLRLS